MPLQVTMCRYESGKLVKTMMPVEEGEYVAVSHVWGAAELQHIPGVGEVLVSKEKAKFIAERLSSIVRTEPFWMDIFCVDQRDVDARIAVTQHIPTIFRSAKKTIVVRDCSGFRGCCAEAIWDVDKFSDSKHRSETLTAHHDTMHKGICFKEGVLSRLWLLQEIMLSDNIQVERCDSVAEEEIISHPDDELAVVVYYEIFPCSRPPG
jgi:hypothetical protein